MSARQGIYDFLDRPDGLPDWALRLLDVAAGDRVVDVGCGNGRYLRRLDGSVDVVAVDRSHGMASEVARELGARVGVIVADAAALPVPTATADAVLAMHMLYHLPDMDQGVRELRRIIKPHGTVLVSTNAADHLSELDDLMSRAVGMLTGSPSARTKWATRLWLSDAAALLAGHFTQVELHPYKGWLVIPRPAPIRAYVDSLRPYTEDTLPAYISWNELLAAVDQQLAGVCDDEPFRIRVSSGVVRARGA
ncbi:MAG: class I SAM-dependent methyltransferase [Euzebyales bacterium]|nr:class I SAM-dependent methyltransferase [Euzebyales bacterium]